MPDLFSFCAVLLAIGVTFLNGIMHTANTSYIFYNNERCHFSLTDVAVCRPMFTGPMSSICPTQNGSVILTCADSLVTILIWRVIKHDRKTYSPVDKEGTVRMFGSYFTAVLDDVSNKSNSSTGELVADLSSTLTAPNMAITNRTIITCETLHSLNKEETRATSSITLFLAGTVVFSVLIFNNYVLSVE